MRKKPALGTRYRWIRPALIGCTLFGVMFVMLVAIITPEQYDLKVGYPAPVTIFATKDVEDSVTTQKLRDSAAAAVDYTYSSVDITVMSTVMSDFNALATAIEHINENYSTEQLEQLTDSDLDGVCSELGINLTRSDFSALCAADSETVSQLLNAARQNVREALDSTLPEGQESSAVLRISRSLLSDGYESGLVAIATSAVRDTIRPNMKIDEETTALNREKARETVETQMCVKGEAVVREGDIVTEAEYQILSALGIIEDSSIDFMLIMGIALIIALTLSALGIYIALYARDLYETPRKLLLLALVMMLVMGTSAIARQINTYLMPVSLGMMLVATLLQHRLALFVNIALGFITSLFSTATIGVFSVSTFSIMIMSIVAGPLVIVVISRHLQRTSILLAGLAVAVSNFVTTLAVGYINSASQASVIMNAVWAAGGGMLSAVISIGVQPLLEWMFNLVTNAKLLELSNPNQPLLHRLLLEAPGTYHHSIIVANLADAAASAIGANALLARVGAYYHDVGKLKRPMYFKENQLGDNPHDRTDPRVSTAILTAHTRDGAQMAQREHLPIEIMEVIQQHHGDSPVLFFYDKAKKLYGEDVDISTFRYDGPRPARKETAVVMLADIIEAATRSMPSHDPKKIEQFVRKLVRDKLGDGQLDRSQLTFLDLDLICNAFSTVLSGVFHERIEYPEVKLPPRENPPAPDPAPQGK